MIRDASEVHQNSRKNGWGPGSCLRPPSRVQGKCHGRGPGKAQGFHDFNCKSHLKVILGFWFLNSLADFWKKFSGKFPKFSINPGFPEIPGKLASLYDNAGTACTARRLSMGLSPPPGQGKKIMQISAPAPGLKLFYYRRCMGSNGCIGSCYSFQTIYRSCRNKNTIYIHNCGWFVLMAFNQWAEF